MLHAVTASVSLGLMRGQLRYLCDAGFEVAAVCAPGDELKALREAEGVPGFDIPMERGFAPLADPVSLWDLWQLMRRFQPLITNVGTTKAGLLGGLAARWAGIPCRVYTLRGLRFETTTGLRRQGMKFLEKIACDSAHLVICVSESVRKKAIEEGLVDAARAVVLGRGSSNGVDAARFAPGDGLTGQAQALRGQLGISHDARVIGFVGRINRDKGVPELVRAYARLRERFPSSRLLLLGDREAREPMPYDFRGFLDTEHRILSPGHVLDPAPYYHLMDVVCLPSHREGFPNSVLEAQAAARPVVATSVTGVVDAVQDGVTGLLVPPGDLNALVSALGRVLTDPVLGERLGQAGRERVLRDFRPEPIWKALADQYRRLLEERGLPQPVPQERQASDAVTTGASVAAS